MKLQVLLRQATLNLALHLRGIRAPKTKSNGQKLRSALKQFDHCFSLARHEVLTYADVPGLIAGGLENFYSANYGLIKYAEKWVELEEKLHPEHVFAEDNEDE